VQPNDLAELCAKLLELYQSEEYKETFPEIQNIAPVRDPSLIERLNDNLIAAFRERDDGFNLTVPDLINYEDDVYAAFSGSGASLIYDDVFMERYYEYLEGHEVDIDAMGISPTIVLYCHERTYWKKIAKWDCIVSPIEFTDEMVEHENAGQVFMASRFVVSPNNDFEFAREFARSIGTDKYASDSWEEGLFDPRSLLRNHQG
jgi:uncharacterized protein (TIGR04141 family)